MKNVLWKIGICLLLGFLTQGCGDPLKILQAIDEFEMKSDTIGERVGQGLVQGLDSANVDSLVARLTNIAGTELRESIDSITLDTLTAKAKVAIDELSTLVEQRLKTLLSDTAALAAIDAKINEVVAGLEQDFQGILTDVVDEDDPTKTTKVIKEEKLTFAVPLLSLVPINSMGINNVKVDFEMEITSANVWESTPSNSSDNMITRKQVALKGKIKSDNKSDSYKSTMSSKMTVNIDAGPLPLPLGVLSIMELYSKSIQPLPIKNQDEDDKKKKN